MMRRTSWLMALIIGALTVHAACSPPATEQSAAASSVTVFEGARLIVGDGTPPIENASFIVDGTRFTSKPTGSQFSGTAGTYLRSCLVCSQHKPVTGGQFRKIAGRSQFVCNDECAVRLGFKPKAAAAH